jgi:hypothetical protein
MFVLLQQSVDFLCTIYLQHLILSLKDTCHCLFISYYSLSGHFFLRVDLPNKSFLLVYLLEHHIIGLLLFFLHLRLFNHLLSFDLLDVLLKFFNLSIVFDKKELFLPAMVQM